jgi:hypothetical protein
MRYLAQFLQIVCSKTGFTGLLRAWAHGLLQWGVFQQRPFLVLIPICLPIRNDAVRLGLGTPSSAHLQRLGYKGHPYSGRPVSGRNL